MTQGAKDGWNRFNGPGAPNTWNIRFLGYYTLPYISYPFFMNTHRPHRQPICTLNASIERVWCKEVPFRGGVLLLNHTRGFKIAKNPCMLGPLDYGNFQPEELLNGEKFERSTLGVLRSRFRTPSRAKFHTTSVLNRTPRAGTWCSEVNSEHGRRNSGSRNRTSLSIPVWDASERLKPIFPIRPIEKSTNNLQAVHYRGFMSMSNSKS